MTERDFSKTASGKTPGTHHGKHHGSDFGKATLTRSTHKRTRANHHTAEKGQKGKTLMKRSISTALAAFITTVFVLASSSSTLATQSTDGSWTSTSTGFWTGLTGNDKARQTPTWKSVRTRTQDRFGVKTFFKSENSGTNEWIRVTSTPATLITNESGFTTWEATNSGTQWSGTDTSWQPTFKSLGTWKCKTATGATDGTTGS